jgi:hypothetical protein
MDLQFAQQLVETLPRGLPGLFNPWFDICEEDTECNTPELKLRRLAEHLACTPRFLMVGEAPGYAGCRQTGIAFTSERLILEGAIPRLAQESERLTRRDLPFSEPSATTVWKTLNHLGIAHETILWNALQLHPHREGQVRTNRTPSEAELAFGAPALRLLVDAFPGVNVVAVGRKAEAMLRNVGIKAVIAVHHPANGGATAFLKGLALLVATA